MRTEHKKNSAVIIQTHGAAYSQFTQGHVEQSPSHNWRTMQLQQKSQG